MGNYYLLLSGWAPGWILLIMNSHSFARILRSILHECQCPLRPIYNFSCIDQHQQLTDLNGGIYCTHGLPNLSLVYGRLSCQALFMNFVWSAYRTTFFWTAATHSLGWILGTAWIEELQQTARLKRSYALGWMGTQTLAYYLSLLFHLLILPDTRNMSYQPGSLHHLSYLRIQPCFRTSFSLRIWTRYPPTRESVRTTCCWTGTTCQASGLVLLALFQTCQAQSQGFSYLLLAYYGFLCPLYNHNQPAFKAFYRT